MSDEWTATLAVVGLLALLYVVAIVWGDEWL